MHSHHSHPISSRSMHRKILRAHTLRILWVVVGSRIWPIYSSTIGNYWMKRKVGLNSPPHTRELKKNSSSIYPSHRIEEMGLTEMRHLRMDLQHHPEEASPEGYRLSHKRNLERVNYLSQIYRGKHPFHQMITNKGSQVHRSGGTQGQEGI